MDGAVELERNTIAAGATSLGTPTDRPFQERTAAVRDAFWNVWYLATYIG